MHRKYRFLTQMQKNAIIIVFFHMPVSNRYLQISAEKDYT